MSTHFGPLQPHCPIKIADEICPFGTDRSEGGPTAQKGIDFNGNAVPHALDIQQAVKLKLRGPKAKRKKYEYPGGDPIRDAKDEKQRQEDTTKAIRQRKDLSPVEQGTFTMFSSVCLPTICCLPMIWSY